MCVCVVNTYNICGGGERVGVFWVTAQNRIFVSGALATSHG